MGASPVHHRGEGERAEENHTRDSTKSHGTASTGCSMSTDAETDTGTPKATGPRANQRVVGRDSETIRVDIAGLADGLFDITVGTVC